MEVRIPTPVGAMPVPPGILELIPEVVVAATHIRLVELAAILTDMLSRPSGMAAQSMGRMIGRTNICLLAGKEEV